MDEPENRLSPVCQLELMKIIEGAARFKKCQFHHRDPFPFDFELVHLTHL